jgi:CRISPR-associated exonuclease Cas4
MFALIRAWSKALRAESQGGEGIAARKRSDSVIFAVEEPELFLHPHAQRRLFQSLQDISAAPEHQVMLCTHSPHFVDTDEYREIAMVYRDNPQRGTSIRQCTRDLFSGEDLSDRKKRFRLAHWINPERAEMFFCRKAVLVEGETERVLLPYLADRLGLLDSEVSVIDCGSKFNLPFYIELAKAFGIVYAVVHDEDPMPDPVPAEWGEEKRKACQKAVDCSREIERLVEGPLGRRHVLSPDFETAAGVSKSQGDRKGKALAALDHFEQRQSDDVPEVLRSMLLDVYGSEGGAR